MDDPSTSLPDSVSSQTSSTVTLLDSGVGLTIISRGDLAPTSSVLDTVKEKSEDTPEIPENNN